MAFAASCVSGMWRGYLRVLQNHPWRTQAVTTCALMGAGDFLAQAAIERRTTFNYDAGRTVRFLGIGLFVCGPSMHLWYTSLDRFIKGSSKTRVVKKVFMDQAFFMPFYLGAVIALMAVLRQESKKEIQDKMERDYKPALVFSYALWPVVQVVNFGLIPGHHRVLVINFVGLIWNTYLAWKAEAQ